MEKEKIKELAKELMITVSEEMFGDSREEAIEKAEDDFTGAPSCIEAFERKISKFLENA